MSLDLLGWGKVSDFLTGVLDRVVPDPTQKAQAQLALAQLEQQGEFKLADDQLAQMKAQTDINLAEASNSSLFVSGWRPFIGWIGGISLAYQYLFRPLAPWLMNLIPYFQLHPLTTPFALDDTINQLVIAMLGVGAMRSYEKVKGVAN